MARDRTIPDRADTATSERMKRVGRQDTSPEVALRHALFARGLRYRKHHAPVPGLRTRADLAFVGLRVAVYVDGCFWHGCPDHGTWPKHNGEFWKSKIEANLARDRRVDAALQAEGWTVIRVWEHEDPERAADRFELIILRSRGSTTPG